MVSIQAFAKINLYLALLRKRSDGYHELCSIMQSISLADRITIKKTKKPGITLKTNLKITAKPEDNLVYKAASLILKKFKKENQGIEISILKKIPIAAGLAGGSADCAAVLFGLNKLLGLKLSKKALERYANLFGSDISFCLNGGTMLAQGRGEKLTPVPAVGRWFGLIIKPPFPISTAQVYKSVKIILPKPQSRQIITAYKTKKINLNNLNKNIGNDLYPIALQIKPNLKKYLEKIEKTNPLAVQMSGSGPSIFAFYQNKMLRNTALKQLEGLEKFPIETVKTGLKLI